MEFSRTLKIMQVHFTPDQEAQLVRKIATKSGTDAEALVKDAALRLLEEGARFRAAVREGIAKPTGASLLKKKWTPV